MIDNIIVTKVTGHAVYPGITWNSVAGYCIPLGIFVISFLFYLIFSCVSKPKMNRINKERDSVEEQQKEIELAEKMEEGQAVEADD